MDSAAIPPGLPTLTEGIMIDTNLAEPSNNAQTRADNSSGYVGVYKQSPKHSFARFVAQVTLANGKRKAVPGRYDTAEEAHAARVTFLARLEAEKAAAVGEVA